MTSLNEQLDRGQRAARLLNDSMFQEAFDNVSSAIHQKWADSPIRDIEGQQQLRLMLKLLGDVRSFLESAMADGKVAAAELDRLNKGRVISPKEFFGTTR